MKRTIQAIHTQFEALENTMDLMDAGLPALRIAARRFAYERVVFTGGGPSFSVAKAVAAVASLALPVPVAAVGAGDLWLHHGRYAALLRGALVIAFSRAGRRGEAESAVRASLEGGYGVYAISVICAQNTPLAARSDTVFALPWASDESACRICGAGNLYAAGVAIVRALAGEPETDDFRRLAASSGVYLRHVEPVAKALAASPWDRVIALAGHHAAGLAEVCVSAFQRAARLPGGQYGVLDTRHGPAALAGAKTLVLGAFTAEPKGQEIAVMSDLARGGAIAVAFAPQPFPPTDGVWQVTLSGAISPEAHALAFLPLCQTAAYYKALALGLDPDSAEAAEPR